MPDGEIVGAVLVMQDVTSSRALQRELVHSATHDPLTGLPNRAAFARVLDKARKQASNESREHALCFLDLDRFKPVNDTAGHTAGDKLLQEVAAVIRRSCRAHDFAARIGGDEFALMLPDCSLVGARRVAEEIVAAIARTRFTWRRQVYQVGASAGITAVTRRSPGAVDLMSAADAACYAAKQRGGDQVAVWDSDNAPPLGRTA